MWKTEILLQFANSPIKDIREYLRKTYWQMN